MTGGASGIGKAIGEELARRGVIAVLADRQIEVAERVAQDLRGKGYRAHAFELDVRDAGAFAGLAKEVLRAHGRIDFLFNNAGIGVGGPMDRYETVDWEDVFDVNLRGVANGIQAVYSHMIARGEGHIVNTASMAGLVTCPGMGSYTASKHAVVAISKALRVEGHRHGVRVSVLCPGAIDTPILSGGRYGRLNVHGLSPRDARALWDRTRPMAPEAFAKRAIDAVLRDQAIIVIPKWWSGLWYLERLSPSLSLRIWRRLFANLQKDIDDRRSPATLPTGLTGDAETGG